MTQYTGEFSDSQADALAEDGSVKITEEKDVSFGLDQGTRIITFEIEVDS